MDNVIIIIYVILGYWACGKTIYANKIRIGSASNLFITRLILGSLLGIILIPLAIIRVIFHI
ncbi:MAG: hypothetical protein ACI4VF_01590 [Lachnospirales bacterium]